MDEFVPRDFDVPRRLETPQFVLEPLRPEDNEHDYDAWTSSMDHIAATPAWGDGRWPREMTPDENRADLQRHADDFRKRTGDARRSPPAAPLILAFTGHSMSAAVLPLPVTAAWSRGWSRSTCLAEFGFSSGIPPTPGAIADIAAVPRKMPSPANPKVYGT